MQGQERAVGHSFRVSESAKLLPDLLIHFNLVPTTSAGVVGGPCLDKGCRSSFEFAEPCILAHRRVQVVLLFRVRPDVKQLLGVMVIVHDELVPVGPDRSLMEGCLPGMAERAQLGELRG